MAFERDAMRVVVEAERETAEADGASLVTTWTGGKKHHSGRGHAAKTEVVTYGDGEWEREADRDGAFGCRSVGRAAEELGGAFVADADECCSDFDVVVGVDAAVVVDGDGEGLRRRLMPRRLVAV